MKKTLALIGVIVFVSAPALLFAGELGSASEYSINTGEIRHGDQYIAGGSVAITGDIDGDLTSAGGNVLLSGTVNQDVLIGGGSLNLVGTVKDDLRAIGGNILVGGKIGGDLVVAGGLVHVLSGATINGDVIAAGGRIIIEGVVNGSVKAASGDLSLNNAVKGNVSVHGDTITLGEKTVIGGNFTYTAAKPADIKNGAKIDGQTKFTQRNAYAFGDARKTKSFLGFLFGIWIIFKFVTLFLSSLVFHRIFSRSIENARERVLTGFWRELLRGFITIVVTPVAVILGILSLIGIPLAVITALAYALLVIIAVLLAIILVGAWLQKIITRSSATPISAKTIFLGALVYVLLGLLPLVGWIIKCMFVLVAFGAITRILLERLSDERSSE